MIIYGSKTKKKVVRTGKFFCPKCKTNRSFHRISVNRYFSLFFIPLFKYKTLGEYIECQTCYTPFELNVFEVGGKIKQFEDTKKRLSTETKKILDGGAPIQMIVRGLVDKGMEEEIAYNMIFEASNHSVAKCNKCGALYKGSLDYCSSCGELLELVKF